MNQTKRSTASRLLRLVIYSQSTAIVVCVNFIFAELWIPPFSDARMQIALFSRLFVPLALAEVVFCPVAAFALLCICSPKMTRSEFWITFVIEGSLVWFTIVWLILPCVSNPKPKGPFSNNNAVMLLKSEAEKPVAQIT